MTSNNYAKAFADYAESMGSLDYETAGKEGQELWRKIAREYGIGTTATSGNGQDPLGPTGVNQQPIQPDSGQSAPSTEGVPIASDEPIPGSLDIPIGDIPVDDHVSTAVDIFGTEVVSFGTGTENQLGAIAYRTPFPRDTNSGSSIWHVSDVSQISPG